MENIRMYGTIFSMKVKPGHENKIIELLRSDNGIPKGGVAFFLMQPDTKDEMIGVAVFESKDAHINNANRPEQNESFMKIMEHLIEEPEWTDGNYVLGEVI